MMSVDDAARDFGRGDMRLDAKPASPNGDSATPK
jgi:hypothetical protein